MPPNAPNPPTATATTTEPAWLQRLGRLAPWLASALVLVVGLVLIWPLPRGVMPMSADHTVHLTRAWLYGQVLASGEVRGWSTMWFFGAPVGELYPPLGDLLVVLLRVLSFGQAGFSAAYACMVAFVFVLQGWVLVHVGVTIGGSGHRGSSSTNSASTRMIAGASIGAIAGLLALVDAGTYREGGWIYTVLYGVWPQALATSLAVLCLSEAVRARQAANHTCSQRHLLKSALAGGLALLAHPISLPSLALAGALGLVILPRADLSLPASKDMIKKWPDRIRTRLRSWAGGIASAAADLSLVAGLALGLAAWWLLPMLDHRAWMASYGWLHAPLATMGAMAREGHWTANMPSAVGYAVWLGLALVALRGPAIARLLGAWALLQWLLASSDAFWGLRLDHLSGAFSHVQYQRFLIAAKPGLFVLAGIGVISLAQASLGIWRSNFGIRLRAPLALVLTAIFALLTVQIVDGTNQQIARFEIGDVPTERFFHLRSRLTGGDRAGPSEDEIRQREVAYDQLLAWLAERWIERERDYRIAFQAGRNAHWFMDSPLITKTPTYKLGFTPGDNFVHKPEAGGNALLDRLGVRYLIRERGRTQGREVASFGPFRVFERPNTGADAAAQSPAHMEGPGTITVIDNSLDAGLLRLRIDGAGATSRLVLHVGGYPRWQLRQNGALLPWVETAAIEKKNGDVIADLTPDERRQGRMRGGKADGDDGSEPTLIAAPVGDGEVSLEYIRWRPLDIFAALLSAASLMVIALLWGRGRCRPTDVQHSQQATTADARRPTFIIRLRGFFRRALPAWLQAATLALLLLGLGLRWQRAHREEATLASSWLTQGRVLRPASGDPSSLQAGPLKADMLLRPAILIRSRKASSSSLIFPAVRLQGALRGSFALDDDAAKGRLRGHHRLQIETRNATAHEPTPWTLQLAKNMPHRPGIVHFSVPAEQLGGAESIDLRVTINSKGQAPPLAGFNLELGEPREPRDDLEVRKNAGSRRP